MQISLPRPFLFFLFLALNHLALPKRSVSKKINTFKKRKKTRRLSFANYWLKWLFDSYWNQHQVFEITKIASKKRYTMAYGQYTPSWDALRRCWRRMCLSYASSANTHYRISWTGAIKVCCLCQTNKQTILDHQWGATNSGGIRVWFFPLGSVNFRTGKKSETKEKVLNFPFLIVAILQGELHRQFRAIGSLISLEAGKSRVFFN